MAGRLKLMRYLGSFGVSMPMSSSKKEKAMLEKQKKWVGKRKLLRFLANNPTSIYNMKPPILSQSFIDLLKREINKLDKKT